MATEIMKLFLDAVPGQVKATLSASQRFVGERETWDSLLVSLHTDHGSLGTVSAQSLRAQLTNKGGISGQTFQGVRFWIHRAEAERLIDSCRAAVGEDLPATVAPGHRSRLSALAARREGARS